jgi:hypothetical protein
VVGPFWPPERELVENFADLSFPFHKIDPPKFEMMTQVESRVSGRLS